MSTTYQEGNHLTFPSGYDFTASGTVTSCQYQIVKFGSSTTAGQVVLAAAASDAIIGVMRNAPTATNAPYSGPFQTYADFHSINSSGTYKVQAGASFAAGSYLTSNSLGLAVAATQTAGGTAPGVRVFGQATMAATGSGQIVNYQCMNFLY
jgi:hypothetical protein